MFKRVAKRAKKKEKEADLGLDEEAKQVLGLQDTDSDESLDSDSDSVSDDNSDDVSGEGVDDEDVDLTGQVFHQRKRPAQSLDSSSVSDDPNEESYPESVADDPPMSVMAATTDPMYNLSSATSLAMDLRTCIICPGKLIKNTQMAKAHLESKAHQRRLQRYTAEVSKRASSGKGLGTDDPRDILRDMSGSADYGAPVGTSKRSQRRTQRKDRTAERRKIWNEKKRQMPIDRPKEVDHETIPQRGAIKARVKKKGAKASARTGGSATDEISCAPDVANGRDEDSTKQLLDRNFGASKRVRPKKRQRRETSNLVTC